MSILGLRDVAGQDDAVERLLARLSRNDLPHALLFAGPERVGKAHAARALSHHVLCQSDDVARPCGHCASCTKLMADTHADLIALAPDEARIKVQVVRDLQRSLSLRPVEGARRVILIDRAERMSVEAQNALLKTLEEPPAHTHLVLVSAVPERLLITIRSRCQTVRFRALPYDVRLQELNARFPEARDVLPLVARLGGAAGTIADSDDLDALVETRSHAMALDHALYGKTPRALRTGLDAAQEWANDRARLALLFTLMGTWIRDQIVWASSGDTLELVHDDERDKLTGQAEARGLNALLFRARTVLEATRQLALPYNYNATMVAEQCFLCLAGFSAQDHIAL